MSRPIKYAIFIIGNRNSGKSTLIRALTGVYLTKAPWHLKKLNNQPIDAFVCVSAPQEKDPRIFSPNNFPKCFEDEYSVNRNDYDMLICPLELLTQNQRLYGYHRYIQNAISHGFDSRIAIIERKYDGRYANRNHISQAQSFAQSVTPHYIFVDASDDPHIVASQIRNNLYP